MSRAEQREATRAEVLRTAERLFSERGFQRVGIEEIAAEAGFTKGAVYWNFPNKERLFLDIWQRHVDADLEGWRNPAQFTSDVQRLDAFTDWLVVGLQEDAAWNLAVLEFTAHALRDPDLRAEVSGLQRRARARLARLLGGLCSSLGLDASADRMEQLTTLVIGMVEGVGMQVYADLDLDLPALLQDGCRRLLCSVGEDVPDVATPVGPKRRQAAKRDRATSS